MNSDFIAHAHCDGPCGVYDPSAARINAEAVLSMTKKLLALEMPSSDNKEAMLAYMNTVTRYIQIKEEQAQKCKEELLILWTDYFKPPHLEKFSELHDIFWKAAKQCSHCKVEVNLQSAEKLMEMVKQIHEIFWKTKERNVKWEIAS
ncbi:superoxide dismutase, Ni [Candidatus Peregrinibacteria bacterium]|nr:superoxide dismutase, Ni [Candidatus Peregrinibacteria bacterium]